MEPFSVITFTLYMLFAIGVGIFIYIYLSKDTDEGEWFVEVRGNGTATRGGIIGQDYDVEVIFIMERNSSTGEQRAYIKEMDGTKHSIDVDWAKQQMKNKGLDIS